MSLCNQNTENLRFAINYKTFSLDTAMNNFNKILKIIYNTSKCVKIKVNSFNNFANRIK